MMEILREKIHDNRFLRLVEGLLKAGYLEEWYYHRTISGTPQGGVISPILSNIYLDRLDKYVENVLLPAYNRKEKRSQNPEYRRVASKAYELRKKGKRQEAKALRRQQLQLPYYDPNDPEYRRLMYIRYADDFILGFAGPEAEAEEIREHLKKFLQENLKLELNREKTLITQAHTRAARFLGYEIATQYADDQLSRHKERRVNGRIALRVPMDVVEKNCAKYRRNGKPIHKAELRHESDFAIVDKYQQRYRGLMQYYALAVNIGQFRKLHWTMKVSLLKTLATKHRTTVTKMVEKYQAETETPYGRMKCLQVRMER